MADPRRLIVHIGLPKTGTTALQSFLADNRSALRERGVLFPEIFAHPKNGHFDLAHKLAQTPRGLEVEEELAALESEIAGFAGEAIILSSESFSSLAISRPVAQRLAGLAETLDIAPTIIAYLRDQPDFLVSLYAQRVKTGLTAQPFDEYAAGARDNPHLDYPRMLAPWERAFDRVAVRLFPPANGTMAEDFFTAAQLDIAPGDLPGPIRRANLRPGALMLECIRQFHLELEERGLPDDRRGALVRALAWHLERDEAVAGPPFQPLTEIAASEIRARFAEPNRAIAERYFDRTELFSGIDGNDAAEEHVVAPEDALANPAYARIRGEVLKRAARGQD